MVVVSVASASIRLIAASSCGCTAVASRAWNWSFSRVRSCWTRMRLGADWAMTPWTAGAARATEEVQERMVSGALAMRLHYRSSTNRRPGEFHYSDSQQEQVPRAGEEVSSSDTPPDLFRRVRDNRLPSAATVHR